MTRDSMTRNCLMALGKFSDYCRESTACIDMSLNGIRVDDSGAVLTRPCTAAGHRRSKMLNAAGRNGMLSALVEGCASRVPQGVGRSVPPC